MLRLSRPGWLMCGKRRRNSVIFFFDPSDGRMNDHSPCSSVAGLLKQLSQSKSGSWHVAEPGCLRSATSSLFKSLASNNLMQTLNVIYAESKFSSVDWYRQTSLLLLLSPNDVILRGVRGKKLRILDVSTSTWNRDVDHDDVLQAAAAAAVNYRCMQWDTGYIDDDVRN